MVLQKSPWKRADLAFFKKLWCISLEKGIVQNPHLWGITLKTKVTQHNYNKVEKEINIKGKVGGVRLVGKNVYNPLCI